MDNGKSMTPRYLVTGAAGFIGSRVAELLLDGGAEVTGLDNLNHAYDVRLKEWRLSQLEARAGFSFRRVDISEPRAVDGLFAKGFDAVVNLAARAGVRASVEDPQAYIDCNVSGTLNLLRACKTYDVPKLVQASSSSVYGSRSTPPYREDAVTDWPLSPYAASKKACEVLCYPYHHLNGTDVTALRFFTVYGPAGRPDMVLFRVVQWIAEGRPVIICGDGRQERNFSYLDDVARGVVAGLKRVGFEVVNLGSDKSVKLIDAIALAEKLLGKKAKIEYLPADPADVFFNPADVGKAKSLLDWEPRVGLEEGLGKTVAWYLENRAWAKDLVTL
jgi:nucleoside-diphosphate-sugar epimerase